MDEEKLKKFPNKMGVNKTKGNVPNSRDTLSPLARVPVPLDRGATLGDADN